MNRVLALPIFAGLLAAQAPDPLPPASRDLLEKARAANPQRYRFALERGATIRPTGDGRSFTLSWFPAGADSDTVPVIATLHGSASWAFDEFFLWQEQAEAYGYGIVALQWWFGEGDGIDQYYTPEAMHRELRLALRGQAKGEVLLHGFSRGSANLYAVAALDRQSDRRYAMFLANSGGATPDFPPNASISAGASGWNVFSGTYWTMFCGGQDPNPDRDGCPAMRRTSGWIENFGGVTSLLIGDPEAGHGGFHQTPSHIRAALDAFRDHVALRRVAPAPDAQWEVKPDPDFAIPGASIPNAGLVNAEVWLNVGGPGGARLYRSRDGSNSTSSEPLPNLAGAMVGTGLTAGEVVPRQGPDGRADLYVIGLAGPGVNRAAIIRLRQGADGRFGRDPESPVFAGGPADGGFLGVPDVTIAPAGRLRLTYVSLGGERHNSRTAISTDGGASFQPEFSNPFGDLAVPNPRANDLNVDPAILKVDRGGYLAVTMRAARFYVFTSIDGRTFLQSPTPVIEPAVLSPGAAALFDPTLVQLPDGRILMYATAADDLNGRNTRVIRAELAQAGERR
jgi:hypothetical protein